jgi:methionyl-tRNA synthetase
MEAIRQLGAMVSPVMPVKGREILAQIGVAPPPLDEEPAWPVEWGGLEPGTAVPKPSPIFPRIDKKAVAGIKERLGVDRALGEAEPHKEEKKPADGLISIDEFSGVDLRIGLVLSAEPVPKTDKLLKISVDLGEESPRTLVAGIAKSYSPGDLEGRRIVVVANLKPAKLRGIESRGMLLAATTDGVPRIITVDGESPPGTKIS